MTTIPNLRVLFFDVFGTSVAQRTPVADELSKAAREALRSDGLSINNDIRARATKMSYDEWFDFGGEWDEDVDEFARRSIAKHGSVDWRQVDKYRLESLHKSLTRHKLIVPCEDAINSELHVEQGSLWDDSQLKHLAHVWHRLPPWPDTRRGLDILNTKFSTITLSNTYNELMEYLVAHSDIPFTHVYTADMFQSFKPNPKAYRGAIEKMGVKPEECGLVAAHLNDLKGAKACGLYTIYVERPLEEKTPELRQENIPDMWIKEGEDGFITLAKRLGIHTE